MPAGQALIEPNPSIRLASAQAVLRRADTRAFASFDTDWVPRQYLADYYRTVEPDERRTIAFFVDAIRDARPGEPILFFGAGPTLHHVFLAAGWPARDRDSPTRPSSSSARMPPGPRSLACCKPTCAGHGRSARTAPSRTAWWSAPTAPNSATDDLTTWQTYMRRIAGMVRPGGTLLVAALRRSHGYRVGGKLFPSANVDEADLQFVLQPLFEAELRIEVRELPDASPKGYSSIVLVQARDRRTARPAGKL